MHCMAMNGLGKWISVTSGSSQCSTVRWIAPLITSFPLAAVPHVLLRCLFPSLPSLIPVFLNAILFAFMHACMRPCLLVCLPACLQVRELAEKESEGSVFQLLRKDVTRFLTTILIGTT